MLICDFHLLQEPLNSSRPVASLGPTLAKVFLIMAGLPKRSLRILRAS